MPKGKQAAALFEVINRNRQPGGKTAPLKTPSWWDKNKVKQQQQEAAAGANGSPFAGLAANLPAWVTPKTAAIIGGAVLVGIILVALAGRGGGTESTTDGQVQVADKTTEELLAGPPQPGVMEIKRGEAGLQPPAPTGTGQAPENGQGTPTGGTGTASTGGLPTPPAGGSSTALPADGKRIVGLNYVIVQSYPAEEEKLAIEARDVLIAAGVPATVEQNIKGFLKYTVVGTEGFERVRSGPYLTYEKRIRQISDSFAKRRSFKAFTPMPYKWTKANQ